MIATWSLHDQSRDQCMISHVISGSSVVSFSSCPQSLPASGTFPMTQLSTWGGQSIGVSASTSVLPMNTQDWSPSEWTGWISLQSKGVVMLILSLIFLYLVEDSLCWLKTPAYFLYVLLFVVHILWSHCLLWWLWFRYAYTSSLWLFFKRAHLKKNSFSILDAWHMGS